MKHPEVLSFSSSHVSHIAFGIKGAVIFLLSEYLSIMERKLSFALLSPGGTVVASNVPHPYSTTSQAICIFSI